jgi:hypothetical protein
VLQAVPSIHKGLRRCGANLMPSYRICRKAEVIPESSWQRRVRPGAGDDADRDLTLRCSSM